MPACQASSPTKRARLTAPAVGRGGSAAACWIPRPKAFGEAVELDLPRSAVGVHEYLYALSLRHPDAVKCAAALPLLGRARAHRPRALSEPLCPRARRAGGRRGDCRWELDPSAADLREFIVKLHQQYETPPAVMDFVRRTWRPTFDAMATPFSAIAPAYATLEDDVLRADAVPVSYTHLTLPTICSV